MYPDPRVAEFITEHVIPVRVHVRENPDEFQRLGARYGAQWTPTILIIDNDGQERHRIEGFLPVDDFLSQLELGLAQAAFKRQDYAQAERLFRSVVERYGGLEIALKPRPRRAETVQVMSDDRAAEVPSAEVPSVEETLIGDSEAEYTLEYDAACPKCGESVKTLRVIRLLRTRVNFVSTLPRRGRVLACPYCRSILSGELTLG